MLAELTLFIDISVFFLIFVFLMTCQCLIFSCSLSLSVCRSPGWYDSESPSPLLKVLHPTLWDLQGKCLPVSGNSLIKDTNLCPTGNAYFIKTFTKWCEVIFSCEHELTISGTDVWLTFWRGVVLFFVVPTSSLNYSLSAMPGGIPMNFIWLYKMMVIAVW